MLFDICFQDNPDETFWNKMGTLGRKKKVDEVREVETEGKHAIDSPGMPKSAEMPPEVRLSCVCLKLWMSRILMIEMKRVGSPEVMGKIKKSHTWLWLQRIPRE